MPEDDEAGSGTAATRYEARHEAAEVLRRLLAAVESGELEANSAHAKALLRRIEGAVIGLEVEEHDLGDPTP